MAEFYLSKTCSSNEYNELLEIIKVSNGWNDIFNSLLLQYASDQNKTKRLFHVFTKLYFFCEPTIQRQFKNVWLYTDLPSAIKEQLGYESEDCSSDLILEDNEGRLSVVQSRFCMNQNMTLTWEGYLQSFSLSSVRKADFYIFFTNASNFVAQDELLDTMHVLKVFLLNDLLQMSKSTIEAMKRVLLKLSSNTAAKKVPRNYQKSAIDKVCEGFVQDNRGQLIMPCGTGKTLISLWIYEKLQPNYALLLFPSLALLRQTKNEWAENQEKFVPFMCVCSEKDINKSDDSTLSKLYEISGLVSTDPYVIKTFLNTHSQAIVFSTYQSLEAISEAIAGTDFSFELAFCDEAHKTVGRKNSLYGFVHDDANIPIKKRLYMTATPRILSEGTKNYLQGETESYLVDMGDSALFGHEFHHMSFKEAIEQKILVDYQIIAMGVSDDEVEAVMKERYLINTDITKAEIANNYALEKFMAKYKSTHAITFHSSVRKAKIFQKHHLALFEGVNVFHVNGKQTTNERHELLKKFEGSPKAIVTNARCLTEGVDVPSIDAIYFSDPKNSRIDIIQATGRALRRADHRNKEIGYIVVPIFHRNQDLLEEAIEEGVFQNIVNVIRSMSSQDERLVEFIQSRITSEVIEDSTKMQTENAMKIAPMILFEELDGLKDSFFDQVISKIRKPWRSFHEAKEYIQEVKLKSYKEWITYCKSGKKPNDIPVHPDRAYKNMGWISWGDWLGNGRLKQYQGEYKSFEESKESVHVLKLKSLREWRNYCRSGNKPENIPVHPDHMYKNIGWISWGDWLGTGRATRYKGNYNLFEDAKKFVHTQKIKSYKEWIEYCKSGKKPNEIPTHPEQVYKNKGWISWGDWLGTGSVAAKQKSFRSFEEGRKFVQNLKLKNYKEWQEYYRSGKKPDDIPSDPSKIYKNKGWISWGDWLGNDKV